MKKIISVHLAGTLLLILLGLLAVFHILVLLQVAPSDIVWGGQIAGSTENLFTLELIALIVTLLFMLVVAVKIDLIKAPKLHGVIRVCLWIIFLFFTLSVFGNLTKGVSFEQMVFAPFSLILALLALRLVLEK